MKVTTLYRSELDARVIARQFGAAMGPVVVSTVRIQDGRLVTFETAVMARGMTSDGFRSADRGAAAVTHDSVCDAVHGRGFLAAAVASFLAELAA